MRKRKTSALSGTRSSSSEDVHIRTGDLFPRRFVAGVDRIERYFGGFVDAATHFRFVLLVDVHLYFLATEEDDLVQIQARQIRLA